MRCAVLPQPDHRQAATLQPCVQRLPQGACQAVLRWTMRGAPSLAIKGGLSSSREAATQVIRSRKVLRRRFSPKHTYPTVGAESKAPDGRERSLRSKSGVPHCVSDPTRRQIGPRIRREPHAVVEQDNRCVWKLASGVQTCERVTQAWRLERPCGLKVDAAAQAKVMLRQLLIPAPPPRDRSRAAARRIARCLRHQSCTMSAADVTADRIIKLLHQRIADKDEPSSCQCTAEWRCNRPCQAQLLSLVLASIRSESQRAAEALATVVERAASKQTRTLAAPHLRGHGDFSCPFLMHSPASRDINCETMNLITPVCVCFPQ